MAAKSTNSILLYLSAAQCIFSIICAGLIANYSVTGLGMTFLVVASTIPEYQTVCCAFFGFTIIHAVTLLGHAPGIKEPLPLKLRLIFSLIGLGFFLAAGSIILKTNVHKLNQDRALAAGSFAIINAAACLVDTFLCYTNLKK